MVHKQCPGTVHKLACDKKLIPAGTENNTAWDLAPSPPWHCSTLSSTTTITPHSYLRHAAHTFRLMLQKHLADGLQTGPRIVSVSTRKKQTYTQSQLCCKAKGLYIMPGGATGSSTMCWEVSQSTAEGASPGEPGHKSGSG